MRWYGDCGNVVPTLVLRVGRNTVPTEANVLVETRYQCSPRVGIALVPTRWGEPSTTGDFAHFPYLSTVRFVSLFAAYHSTICLHHTPGSFRKTGHLLHIDMFFVLLYTLSELRWKSSDDIYRSLMSRGPVFYCPREALAKKKNKKPCDWHRASLSTKRQRGLLSPPGS